VSGQGDGGFANFSTMSLADFQAQYELTASGRAMPKKGQGKRSAKGEGSELEEAFLAAVRLHGLPMPETEYRFHKKRRWRVDFAWAEARVAVEVEGGIWSNGRHVRGSGFEADCEKYNELALAGWLLIRVTSKHIRGGEAVAWLERALGAS